ncbi:hypothetical protein LPJ68_001858 [Coemansia sp. RSA 1086]|nr:hypothetical protein LPJ68_001858 [Coemansia sp. RSA 1086]
MALQRALIKRIGLNHIDSLARHALLPRVHCLQAAVGSHSTSNKRRPYTTTSTTHDADLPLKRSLTSDFISLGIDTKIAQAMKQLYEATTPTAFQHNLIESILQPQSHLYVRQATGSGKTFAVLCTLLSQTIREHHWLLDTMKCSRQQAFEVQAVSTLIIVPNRELALQLYRWAESILSLAYPNVPQAKVVQCFVSGEGYENKQKRYLKRHGMPAIVIGTPKILNELILQEKLKLQAPSILQQLRPQQDESTAEFIKRLSKLHTTSKRGFNQTKDGADGMRGLRRLVIDEVDQVLRIPSQRASEKEKQLRKEKPKPGQLLLDGILLRTCGLSRLSAIWQQESLLSRERQEAEKLAAKETRKSSNARGWKKNWDPALGQRPPLDRQVDAMPKDPKLEKLRASMDLVGWRSLQLIALSATANSNVRQWMQRRGWMSSRPLIMGEPNEEAGLARFKVPAEVTHYCLVVENNELVRNLRAKEDSNAKREALPDQANIDQDTGDVWETDVSKRTEEEQVSAMQVMAEAASNCLAAMQPQGTVLIFTRSDASTTKFARVLEHHGVLAHDIMVHVDQELDTRVSQHIKDLGSQYRQPFKVFIATEEAARGIDVRDTSLVLILDIPRSAASYAHMSGRTGRFGRAGSVVAKCVESLLF